MSTLTVAQIGERALIDRIRTLVPPTPPNVIVGIGDDAAVVESSRNEMMVLTTDASIEGVHFDPAFSSPADIGHKALAANLSDLASMGARPQYALLSIALPMHYRVLDAEALVISLIEVANQHRTTLIGGNITKSNGPLFVDIMATGTLKRRRMLTRSGAKPGDIVYVSGQLGTATAGLQMFKYNQTVSEATSGACRHRYLRPEPRVKLGMALGRNRAAHSCIDLSDGLASAIDQLCRQAKVGARIEAELIPIDPQARNWFNSQGNDPLTETLSGGEDYELLFTAPQIFHRRLAHVRRLIGPLPLTPIGVITKEQKVVLSRDGSDLPFEGGYEHFAPSQSSAPSLNIE